MQVQEREPAKQHAAPPASCLSRIAERVAAMEAPQGLGRLAVRGAGIDLMGCILAGAGHPFARQARAALSAYPGTAPVYGTGLETAAPFAALCNAVAGHVFDFDDWEESGNTHPSAVLLPALWALAAERGAAGRGAAGEDIATAYRAGFEVIVRLGEALNFEHYNKGWHTTATLGVIGAAAAASRFLRLDPAQTAAALSLSISQASGYTCQFGSGAKPLQAGFAARDGLMSALLAEQGLTGRSEVLDGPTGFAALTGHGDTDRLEAAIEAMDGQALEARGIAIKPYPSCGYTHRLVDCALALHPRLDPSEIVRIEAQLPDFHYAILHYDRPQTRTEALFSLPFCVATALLCGRFSLKDLTDEARADPALLALIEKTEVAPQPARRPRMNCDPEQPDELRITLSSGETLSASCAYPKGAPQNPLSLAELRAKFEAIAGPMASAALVRLMAWDEAEDIGTVLKPFGGDP